MAHLGRRLQKRIGAHRLCKFGRPAQSASRAKPSPVHTENGLKVRVMCSICQFIGAFCLFSAQRSAHETHHFAVNLHMSSAVNRSRGGFASL
jgi:hypothetical protein